jgi:hypothetical protein
MINLYKYLLIIVVFVLFSASCQKKTDTGDDTPDNSFEAIKKILKLRSVNMSPGGGMDAFFYPEGKYQYSIGGAGYTEEGKWEIEGNTIKLKRTKCCTFEGFPGVVEPIGPNEKTLRVSHCNENELNMLKQCQDERGWFCIALKEPETNTDVAFKVYRCLPYDAANKNSSVWNNKPQGLW